MVDQQYKRSKNSKYMTQLSDFKADIIRCIVMEIYNMRGYQTTNILQKISFFSSSVTSGSHILKKEDFCLKNE